MAFDILRINREIHQTLLEKYNGKLIKEMGDGMLASFNSASDAVICSIGIQEEAKLENIPLKIGIHQGEMVFFRNRCIGRWSKYSFPVTGNNPGRRYYYFGEGL
jgi:class 3 adenylate cyclase